MDATSNDLRLLLIGVTSYDIQGTVNETMGKTVYPDVRTTSKFGHHDLIEGYGGRRVKLTVAPGFMDYRSNMKPWEMKRDIQYELQKSDYEKGFHAGIMVMSYPFRWTDEEKDTIRFAVEIIKKSNLKHHGFLVLTNGNNFKTKYPQDTDRMFKEYLYNVGEEEPELKQFLQMFNGRIFILDTELDDVQWNGQQVSRLYGRMKDVPGTFTLSASTLAIIYDHTAYVMSMIAYCLKTFYSYTPVPWLMSKIWFGSETTSKRRGRGNEPFDTLPDVEESNRVMEPTFEAQSNFDANISEAMFDE